jgi:hypothetical protein
MNDDCVGGNGLELKQVIQTGVWLYHPYILE